MTDQDQKTEITQQLTPLSPDYGSVGERPNSSSQIKVLNLYAGLGGNRKLWKNVDVTAVELNPQIAEIYQDHFSNDKVIIDDAHAYLLEHFQEFDFIWSSIECTSHSKARFWASKGRRYKPIFPDMKLYEEIIFLQHYCKGKFTVENVNPYYKPLINPTIEIERHLFWTNFPVSKIEVEKNHIFDGNIEYWQNQLGMDINGYDLSSVRKDKVFRNCVNPEIGLHIFNCAIKPKTVKSAATMPLFELAG